jgi:hypothetical protein
MLMSPSLVYIDRSEVLVGRLDKLERTIGDLVRHVHGRDLRFLTYDLYLSTDRSRMTVMHVHPDSESVERLMQAIAPKLPPFAKLINLLAIDVYGSPSDAVLAQLRRKAATLGEATLTVPEPLAGIRAGQGEDRSRP